MSARSGQNAKKCANRPIRRGQTLAAAIFAARPLRPAAFCGKINSKPLGKGRAALRGVLYYFIAVSVVGAAVCVYDKLAAGRGWGRVPERTLFFWALAGGGPGVYLTMLLIRHKTLHRSFMLGIPAIMLLQTAILTGLYYIMYSRGLL